MKFLALLTLLVLLPPNSASVQKVDANRENLKDSVSNIHSSHSDKTSHQSTFDRANLENLSLKSGADFDGPLNSHHHDILRNRPQSGRTSAIQPSDESRKVEKNDKVAVDPKRAEDMETMRKEMIRELKHLSENFASSLLKMMSDSMRDITRTVAHQALTRIMEENRKKKSKETDKVNDRDGKVDAYISLHRALFQERREKLHIRPVRGNKPVTVYLSIHLRQLLQVNEAEEYARVFIWIQMEFYNEFLGWNPDKFKRYKSVQASTLEEMWMPDIHLYNGLEMRNDRLGVQTIPTISTKRVREKKENGSTDEGEEFWAGRVDYSYPHIAKFTCSFNTFYFPFDNQICTLVFGSWAFQKYQLVIEPMPADLKDFEENDEWEVLNLTHYGLTKEYNNNKNFSISHLEIIMRRRPLYYIVNLIIPSVIITQVSFFGMFTPSSSEGDRTEKVSLGMGTLLAMSVLLLIVSGMIPVSSSYVPLIGMFFLLIMCLISLGVAVTTFIMVVHQRGKRRKRVPKWVQKIFFFRIAPAIGFKTPSIIRKEMNASEASRVRLNQQQPDVTDILIPCERGHKSGGPETALLDNLPQIKQISEQIDRVLRGRQKELAEVEYIFLAKILDALMLFLFSLLLGVLTFTIIICGIFQPTPQPTLTNGYIPQSIYEHVEWQNIETEIQKGTNLGTPDYMG